MNNDTSTLWSLVSTKLTDAGRQFEIECTQGELKRRLIITSFDPQETWENMARKVSEAYSKKPLMFETYWRNQDGQA